MGVMGDPQPAKPHGVGTIYNKPVVTAALQPWHCLDSVEQHEALVAASHIHGGTLRHLRRHIAHLDGSRSTTWYSRPF